MRSVIRYTVLQVHFTCAFSIIALSHIHSQLQFTDGFLDTVGRLTTSSDVWRAVENHLEYFSWLSRPRLNSVSSI